MSGRAADLGRGFMAPFVLTDKATISGLFEEAVIILIITAAFLAGGVLGARLMRAIGLGKTFMMGSLFIFTASLMASIGIPAGVANAFSLERSLGPSALFSHGNAKCYHYPYSYRSKYSYNRNLN